MDHFPIDAMSKFTESSLEKTPFVFDNSDSGYLLVNHKSRRVNGPFFSGRHGQMLSRGQ